MTPSPPPPGMTRGPHPATLWVEMRVFISHAWADEATQQLRQPLYDALEAAGHVPLLDQVLIRAGQTWRPRLHEWLHICDAGVLLISEAALASDWVVKEATILSWRRHDAPGLIVLPVVVPPLDAGAVRGRPFSALDLGERNPVVLTEADVVADRVEAIVEGLEAALADPARPRTRQDDRPGERRILDWTGFVQAPLERLAGGCDACYGLVGRALDADEDDLAPGADPSRRCAHGLLHGHPERIHDALLSLREAAPSTAREDLETLCRRLQPIWVPVEAAERILGIASRSDASTREFVVRLAIDDLVHDLLHRAVCGSPRTQVLRHTGVVGEHPDAATGAFGEVGAEDGTMAEDPITSRLVDEVADRLNVRIPPGLAGQRTSLVVGRLFLRYAPVFIVLPGELVGDARIGSLRRVFPDAVFVFIAGPGTGPDRDDGPGTGPDRDDGPEPVETGLEDEEDEFDRYGWLDDVAAVSAGEASNP